MGLFDLIIGSITESLSNEIIGESFDNALSTMEQMCANPGQQSVFTNHVIKDFTSSLSSSNSDIGWINVDIGEYMEFMGEIVEAGNQIMSAAYMVAAELRADGEFSEDQAKAASSDY